MELTTGFRPTEYPLSISNLYIMSYVQPAHGATEESSKCSQQWVSQYKQIMATHVCVYWSTILCCHPLGPWAYKDA